MSFSKLESNLPIIDPWIEKKSSVVNPMHQYHLFSGSERHEITIQIYWMVSLTKSFNVNLHCSFIDQHPHWLLALFEFWWATDNINSFRTTVVVLLNVCLHCCNVIVTKSLICISLCADPLLRCHARRFLICLLGLFRHAQCSFVRHQRRAKRGKDPPCNNCPIHHEVHRPGYDPTTPWWSLHSKMFYYLSCQGYMTMRPIQFQVRQRSSPTKIESDKDRVRQIFWAKPCMIY